MRTIRVIAATALALSLASTMAPAPAHAAPTTTAAANSCRFSGAKVSPSTVVVGIKKKVTVKVTANATGCQNDKWTLLGFDDNFDIFGDFRATNSSRTKWAGTIELNPNYMRIEDAGKLRGTIYLDDGSERSLGASLTVKRNTTLNVYAPSKVTKNKRFYVEGLLLKANWNEGYYDMAHGKVRLQSRPSGGKWKTIKTLDTSKFVQEGGGALYRTSISKNTCFRWAYDGSSTTSAVTSASDCVAIKK